MSDITEKQVVWFIMSLTIEQIEGMLRILGTFPEAQIPKKARDTRDWAEALAQQGRGEGLRQ